MSDDAVVLTPEEKREQPAFLKWWEGSANWTGSPCAVAFAGWMAAKAEEHAGTKAVYERAHMLERELAEAVEQRDFHIQAAGGMVRREDGSLTLYGEQLRENAALREAGRQACARSLAAIGTYGRRDENGLAGLSRQHYDEIVEYARVFDPPTEVHARRGFDPASPGGDRAVEVIGTVREGSVVVTEMREILGNSGDNAQSSTQREESAPK